jgi:hypothetical protein
MNEVTNDDKSLFFLLFFLSFLPQRPLWLAFYFYFFFSLLIPVVQTILFNFLFL